MSIRYFFNASFWYWLIGHQHKFSLEQRIFHSITIGISILLFLSIPYNVYAGLYTSAVSGLLAGFIVGFQTYRSRFMGKPHNSILFGMMGMLLFGINYFTNAGTNGSTDILWPIYLMMLFTILPSKKHKVWLFLYFVFFMGLHLVEWFYPSFVQQVFTSPRDRIIDRFTTIPLGVIVVYIVINFLKRSYDREREITIERNELLLENKNELLQINTEKNKLLSIISHDLRSPLINIKGYLELLQVDHLDENAKHQLQATLLKSTSNALDMLTNILHWSKSQMEGANVNLVEQNLLNSISETVNMAGMDAKLKSISLNNHIAEDFEIYADVDMLNLVIRNLLSNAIKFSDSGGVIDISAKMEDTFCLIYIKDHGIGIPIDKQKNIFSLHSSPAEGTNSEVGVGLGLILCKEYMELQNGNLSFESKEGIGTTFIISLPLKVPAIKNN